MNELCYTVKRIPIERTYALRKAVLRPFLAAEEPYVCPDDLLPETVALGAVTQHDEVVGVARITPEDPPFASERTASWRLRGMAASPEVRNMGVGSALLQGLIAHVASSGGGILWCNARVPAEGFYARAGLRRWGDAWEEPEIGPHIVMWRHVSGAQPVSDTPPQAPPARR